MEKQRGQEPEQKDKSDHGDRDTEYLFDHASFDAFDNRVYYKGSNFISGRDEYLPIPLAQYNFSEGRYVQNPGYGAF